jgi:hypothetical protein
MPLIKYDAPWAEQPPAGTQLASNPLRNGLVIAINGSAGRVDLVSGDLLTPTGGANGFTTGPLGVGFSAASGGAGLLLPASFSARINATGQATAFFLMQGGSSGSHGFSDFDTAALANHYPFGSGVYLSSFFAYRWIDNVASQVAFDRPHTLALQVRNGSQRATQNNLVLAQRSFGAPAAISGSPTLLGSNGFTYPGSHPLFAAWDRYLSDGEVASLHADPWQLFEPRRIWVPVTAAGGAFTLAADPGSYAVTGQDSALLAARRVLADQGAYTVSGQAAGLLAGRRVVADPGSYAITGNAATLTYSPAGAFSLSAESGSYVLSGQAAALLAARILRSAAGTYAITGQDATLTYTPVGASFTLTAEAGRYAITGQAAELRRTYVVQADRGAYVLAGQPATLTYSGAVLPAVRASIPTAGGAAIKPRRHPNISTARRRST